MYAILARLEKIEQLIASSTTYRASNQTVDADTVWELCTEEYGEHSESVEGMVQSIEFYLEKIRADLREIEGTCPKETLDKYILLTQMERQLENELPSARIIDRGTPSND